MRRFWSTLILLAGGLLMLASLFLPWQEARETGAGGGVIGLLTPSSGLTVEGWSAQAGQVAGLSALLLVALAAASLLRPRVRDHLPLGLCALFMGYFGLAVVAETRANTRNALAMPDGPHS